MNAKWLGLVVGASLALLACRTEVSKLSCGSDKECAAGTYCDKDLHGGSGVCVTLQTTDGGVPLEASCADGNDNDGDGKTDCDDSDCLAGDCRPSAGDCDVAEKCQPGQQACPPDAYRAAAEEYLCRDESPCGAKGVCDGTSPACPGEALPDSKGKPCRDETPCGKAAVCDGANPACPPLELKDPGTVCSEFGDGPCIEGGKCDGEHTDCPEASVLPPTAVCPDVKPCEEARYCSGTSGACASDVSKPKPPGKVCHEAAGPCDKPEACDGTSLECPDDQLKPKTEVCRAPQDKCELETRCDGVSAACPVTYAPEKTPCRAANGACDVEDFCTGKDSACPQNVKPNDPEKPCNPSAGACDPAEFCSGKDPTCPADALHQTDHLCKAKGGDCDKDDYCDGNSPECVDERLAPGTPCWTRRGECEEDAFCEEGNPVCPGPKVKPFGTVCRVTSLGSCYDDAICDGQAYACPKTDPFKPAGTFCGSVPADPCQQPFSCDGAGKCLTTLTYLGAYEACGLTSPERCVLAANGATACPMPTPSIKTASGWLWENPLPQGNTLYGVAASGLTRLFVGEAGTALRYDAAFRRLKVADLSGTDFTGTLRGVCVQGPAGPAWVVGDKGFVGKYDLNDPVGGVVQTTAVSGATFRGVWCDGAGKIVAVGDGGAVWRGDGATMQPEPKATANPLTAVWGASYEDLWAVGSAGTVIHRDATGAWTLLPECPDGTNLLLNGVGGVVLPVGKPSDVWISGRTSGNNDKPGVFRVRRDVTPLACEAYQDPDGYTPGGLTALSVTGAEAAWAVDLSGRAYEMKGGKWSEAMTTGVARELFGVVADATGPVAVAGMTGSLSVRSLQGNTWRWLPSRTVTSVQLNAVWTGNVASLEESVVVGKHATLLRRTVDGRWVVPAAVSSATTFHDDLYAIASSAADGDLWIGGVDPVTATGTLYDLHALGFVKTYKVPVAGAPVTSIAVNKDYVTVAAKRTYQLERLMGTGLVPADIDSAHPSNAVAAGDTGAKAYFAGSKVYSVLSGLATELQFPGYVSTTAYTSLRIGSDSTSGQAATSLFATVADGKVYKALYLANVDGSTTVQPVETLLGSAPLALSVQGPGKFWVVGASGLASNVGGGTGSSWAGTNLPLRGVAVTAAGDVIAAGDQGAILRRAFDETGTGP